MIVWVRVRKGDVKICFPSLASHLLSPILPSSHINGVSAKTFENALLNAQKREVVVNVRSSTCFSHAYLTQIATSSQEIKTDVKMGCAGDELD